MTDPRTCNDLYVIYYEGSGAMIRLSTRDTSAEDFGDIQKRFCDERAALRTGEVLLRGDGPYSP